MKLRNRVAYLNVLPEEQPKKKLSSLLTVLIYFLILGTILLYLFFYGLAGFFYVSARGHVELSKYFVQTDRSGKIDRYLVRAGEKISWGQPLFVIQRKSTSNFQEIRGVVLENRDGSLSEQLSSFEKTLKNLDREDWRDFSWEESGGVSGNRELAQVVSDIQFVRSNLQSLNKEIKQNRMKKNALAKEFSPERVRELENFGKSVIRGRSGVVRQIEKNDREITRRENSLRASRESLAEWQKVQRALRVGNGTGNGVLVSRELVKINNDIESRQAALLLLRQQFDLKRENRKKLESGFSEARILELRKGPKGGVSGLNGDIEDMRYKVKELENKLDSLVRYRKDLVRNEINSLNYEIKKNIKRIVELRKLSLESGKEDKVIAKELGIVSLDQKYTALLKRQNAFEMKLRSLRKKGREVATGEIESLRYKMLREKEEREQITGAQGRVAGVSRRGELSGEVVTSPVEGSVVLLYRREGEYADKGDVLLSIREKDAMVKIKSFFKTRDFGAIQKGKEVTVKFPDKTKSRGVIEKVYSSLYRNTGNLRSPAVIPPEIVVEVIPKDPASSTLWERYDQLEVAIEVRK